MPTVSNTSPLLNLAIIQQLSLLRSQFGEVRIPLTVVQELRLGKDLPGSRTIQAAIDSGWLQVHKVADRALVEALRRDLDHGEAEAIALAVQTNASHILLDEREGRRVAKSLGLEVTGVLGVLLRAKVDGDIQSLRAEIDKLIQLGGFWLAEEFVQRLLEAVGETT